jgi:hypothetical protein
MGGGAEAVSLAIRAERVMTALELGNLFELEPGPRADAAATVVLGAPGFQSAHDHGEDLGEAVPSLFDRELQRQALGPDLSVPVRRPCQPARSSAKSRHRSPKPPSRRPRTGREGRNWLTVPRWAVGGAVAAVALALLVFGLSARQHRVAPQSLAARLRVHQADALRQRRGAAGRPMHSRSTHRPAHMGRRGLPGPHRVASATKEAAEPVRREAATPPPPQASGPAPAVGAQAAVPRPAPVSPASSPDPEFF